MLQRFWQRTREQFGVTVAPESQITRSIRHMIILGSDFAHINALQQNQAAPIFRKIGVNWAHDGYWSLADQRQVEFLSVSGSYWFSRLLQAQDAVVVPLYRSENVLSLQQIQMTDARLALLARRRASLQIVPMSGF